jgi:hypothetical protein
MSRIDQYRAHLQQMCDLGIVLAGLSHGYLAPKNPVRKRLSKLDTLWRCVILKQVSAQVRGEIAGYGYSPHGP